MILQKIPGEVIGKQLRQRQGKKLKHKETKGFLKRKVLSYTFSNE